jgi:nucleoside-diphosphate-sugar epimerase
LNTLRHRQVEILDSSITNVLTNLDLRSLAGQRLFITGGTGFFGIWLLSALRALHQQGTIIQVTVLSRDPEGFLLRHPHFRKRSWLSFIAGNVSDFKIPQQQFDLVIHAATETSLAAHADPMRMFDSIFFGTRRVLELAQFCGVRRILMISSGAVYGKQPAGQTHQPDDSQLACNPLLASNAYGEGKRVMELMGAMQQSERGLEFVTARCFSFCGPGLPLNGHYAIGNFIRDALYNKQIIIQGDGSAVRSYLYGADLAVWLLYLLIEGQKGESYNVGSDEALTLKELATLVRDVLSPNKDIEIQQNMDTTSSSTRNRYVPAIDRARALGCVPWTKLDESLRLTANFLRSH